MELNPHIVNHVIFPSGIPEDFKTTVSKFGQITDLSNTTHILWRVIYNNLDDAKKASKYYKELKKTANFVVTNIVVDIESYDKDMPLLQFVGLRIYFRYKIPVGDSLLYERLEQLKDIFQKYSIEDNPFSKKAILDCQKELIDNGFAGNAHY